jgi:hypothetical protein
MIFSERRGGAAAAAAGAARQSPGGADTIAIYDEGGRQQQRRAIHVGSTFFVNSLDILLTPPIHDFFKAQVGGRGQVLIRRSNLALTQVPIHW